MTSIKPEHRGSDGSSAPRSNLIPFRSEERRQAKRCADVLDALIEARAWCDAGIRGDVSLTEATVRADYALNRSMREILRRPLEGGMEESNPAPWTYVPESAAAYGSPAPSSGHHGRSPR